jgi:hypothetical protein
LHDANKAILAIADGRFKAWPISIIHLEIEARMEKRTHTVDNHFVGWQPDVRAIYDGIHEAAKQFGTVREKPKKTSIDLSNSTAFSGVRARKDALTRRA